MKDSISLLALLSGALVVSVASAASIEVTGGSIAAGSNTTTINSGATGTFTATDSRTDTIFTPGGPQTATVSSASDSANVAAFELTINATSAGSTYYQYPSGTTTHSILGTQGNLAFNVVTGGAFNYSATSQYQSTESIRNSAGTSLLSISCVNPLLDCLGGPSFSGTLNLAPGAYILAFTDTAYQLVGTTQDSNMSFSLQSVAVPLPATAWLLLSGLITVFGTAAVGGRRFSLESVSDVEATGAYLT